MPLARARPMRDSDPLPFAAVIESFESANTVQSPTSTEADTADNETPPSPVQPSRFPPQAPTLFQATSLYYDQQSDLDTTNINNGNSENDAGQPYTTPSSHSRASSPIEPFPELPDAKITYSRPLEAFPDSPDYGIASNPLFAHLDKAQDKHADDNRQTAIHSDPRRPTNLRVDTSVAAGQQTIASLAANPQASIVADFQASANYVRSPSLALVSLKDFSPSPPPLSPCAPSSEPRNPFTDQFNWIHRSLNEATFPPPLPVVEASAWAFSFFFKIDPAISNEEIFDMKLEQREHNLTSVLSTSLMRRLISHPSVQQCADEIEELKDEEFDAVRGLIRDDGGTAWRLVANDAPTALRETGDEQRTPPSLEDKSADRTGNSSEDSTLSDQSSIHEPLQSPGSSSTDGSDTTELDSNSDSLRAFLSVSDSNDTNDDELDRERGAEVAWYISIERCRQHARHTHAQWDFVRRIHRGIAIRSRRAREAEYVQYVQIRDEYRREGDESDQARVERYLLENYGIGVPDSGDDEGEEMAEEPTVEAYLGDEHKGEEREGGVEPGDDREGEEYGGEKYQAEEGDDEGHEGGAYEGEEYDSEGHEIEIYEGEGSIGENDQGEEFNVERYESEPFDSELYELERESSEEEGSELYEDEPYEGEIYEAQPFDDGPYEYEPDGSEEEGSERYAGEQYEIESYRGEPYEGEGSDSGDSGVEPEASEPEGYEHNDGKQSPSEHVDSEHGGIEQEESEQGVYGQYEGEQYNDSRGESDEEEHEREVSDPEEAQQQELLGKWSLEDELARLDEEVEEGDEAWDREDIMRMLEG